MPEKKLKSKLVTTSDAQSEIERLTGISEKKYSTSPVDKALQMARESRDKKNYVLAIKRYNYIIKNFAQSQQAGVAFMDKSVIYSKMGFADPATFNLKKSKIITAEVLRSKERQTK